MGLKSNYWVLLVFLLIGLSVIDARAQCTSSPNAVAGFLPDATCQPVTVTLSSVSHIPAFGGVNNIPAGTTYFVDWGDGATETYTTSVDNEGVPLSMQTHSYGAAATNCAYTLRFEVSNPCGADFITGTVNVHDTDAMGLAITQDYTICEGYGDTFIFTDASIMNCLAPPFGAPNDEDRTIRWDYGTGGSTIPGVTAGGFDASSSIHNGAAYTTAGPGSTSLAVVIPAASTVGRDGEYFEVTMYNWNSCNRYDDPGIAGPPVDALNGDNPPVSITARITVVASPPAPTAADRSYCFGAVGPLNATAGFGGILRWYENATLSPEGIVVSGTQVGTGGTFGHGQTATGTYTYWVTETMPGTNCEGPAREVTLNIREDLNITDAITGDANVCPGETGLTYSLPNPPATQPVGGNTEYIWSVPAGWTIDGGQGTESITVTSSTTAGSGNISVVWQFTSTPNCTSTAEILPVTVNVLPAGNISGTPTICEGNAPNLTINLTQGVGNSGPFEVDYTDGTNTFTETLAFGSNGVTPGIDPPPGTTTYTITEIRDLATNGCTVSASHANITGSATVVVRTDLVLSDMISGPSEVCPGDLVSFSLPNPPPTVGGVATVYQWQLPNNSGSNLGNITSGQNTNTINVTVGNNTGTKRVRVRWRYANNPRCNTSWQTYNVNVNIQPEAEISGDQSICLGDNPVLTFSNLVGVGGVGPFDIDYSPDGGTTIHTATSVPISGTTINAPAPGAAGNYTYTIREIRDLGANGCVTTAPSANITGSANVSVRETLNLTDPITGPANVCANQNNVTFSLPAAPPAQPVGGATEYQWTIPAGWTITAGQGTESITVDIGSSTGPGRTVSVVWQYPGSPNCTSGSQSTSVTVDPGPTVATVGPDLDYCTAVTLVSVGLGGNSPTIGTGLWTQQSGPSVANITNANDPNTTVSIASAADAGIYVFRWSITSGTCPPSTADVTVDFGTAPQIPDAYTPADPNEDATCGLTIGLQGSTPLNTLGGTANGQWTQIAGPGSSSFDDDTDPTTNVTADTYGTYTYQWEVTSGNCTPENSTVQIQFFQSAVVTMPTDFDQCINSDDLGTASANITAQGTVSGSVSTGTWSVAGGSGAGTGTISTNDLGGGVMEFVYEPVLGDLNETLVFELASADPSTSCTVVTDQFTVTINREPNITNATALSGNIEQVICAGGTATLTLTSDTPGTVYNWTASVTSAGTSNVTGFSVSNSGDISEILLNAGNNVEEVTYVITPSVNGCTGPSSNFVVTIDPTPSAQPDKTTETICDGGTTSIDLDAVMPVTGTTYTWTVIDNPNVTGETGDATGTLAEIVQTLNNTSNTAQAVTYTVTPTANNNTVCTGPTTDVIVTIQPDPTFTNGGTEDICSGDQLNFTPAGTVTGTNFNWSTSAVGANITGHSASGSGPITDILSNNGTAPETITYDITPTANGCTGIPGTYIVTVSPKPEITNLPAGGQPICSGATFTFNPASNITNVTPTYSWTVSSSGNITGLPGTGSGTGNISHTLTNTGNSVETVTYIITATANGCDSDLSPVIVIVSPVADVSNSTLTETICDGDMLNFTPTSNVTGADFDWTASVTSGTVTGVTASGNGNITDQLFNATSAVGEVTYVITPSINGCNGIPQNYVVTVNPSPEVTNLPAALTDDICSNNAAVINPISDVGGATFSWTATASSANVIGFTPLGTGPINQTVKNNGTTTETITYRVTANAGGCSGTPVDFVITVYPEPDISNPTADLTQDLCSGGTATFTPLETVSSTTFDWSVSVTTGSATSTDISAGTGSGPINDVITNTGTVDAVVTYVFTPTANGCPGPTFSYVATVSPVADVNNLPTTDVICSGDALNFTPTSSVSGATFSWTSLDNANVTGETANGTGDITDVLTNNAVTQQTVTYNVTPIIDGCPGPVQTYTVNINPKPNVTNTPLTEAICSGVALNVNLTGDVSFGTGTTFTWTTNPVPNITGNTASGSGDITDVLTNSGTATETVVYTITPEANGCVGDPVNYTVTVYPTPNISNPVSDLTDVICSGSTTSFNPTGDVASTTFGWTVSAPGTITSTNADFTTGSGSGAINHALTNTGFNIETVIYTYTPVANGCPGATQTYTVTVNPTPDINNSPGNQTICSTDNFSYTPAGNVGSTSFDWTSSSSSPNLVGNTSSGIGAINDNLINNGVTQETITYQIFPRANGCTGSPEIIQITVNPRPTVSPSVFSQQICNGETTNITLNGNVSFGTGTDFSWTIVNPGPNIGGATAGSGNTIAQTLTNSGTVTETVDYRITPTANGCDGNSLDITVTVHPTPVTSAITSLSGAVDGCINSANVYRVDGAAGTPGSSYSWSISPIDGNEPMITSFNNNAILDFGPNAWVGTLTVIETSNGCDGPPVNLAVESFSTPVVDAGADQEICLGATVALGGSPTASGGSSSYEYRWTPAAGLDNALASNPNATPTSTIIYTVDVTDLITGCTASDQVRVDIVLPPTQPFISVPSGSPFVCAGENVTLQSSNIGANSFQWYKDGVIMTGEVNQTLVLTGVTTTDAGNYQVVTIGTNPIGAPCESPPSPIQTVEVNPVPAKPTISVMGSLPFCDNGANLAILEASADALADSYEWYFDDGSGFTLIGGQNTNQLIVSSNTQSGTYYVRAIGVANSFCAGPDSDPQSVLIYESPDVPVWTGPSFACSEDFVALQVNFTAGTGPYTVEFQDNASPANTFGPFTVNSGDDIFIQPINNNAFPEIRTYSLTSVTDANGCSPPSLGAPYQLEVRPLPVASAITGKANVCVNETNVRYQVTPSSGAQYLWNTGFLTGVTVAAGGGLSDSFIELNFGSVQILGGNLQVSEAKNGCAGPASQLTINVFEPAVADAGSDQTICVGQSVAIGGAPTASQGSGIGNYDITWSPNLNISDIKAANPTVSPGTTTDYTVTVRDNLSGCAVSTSTVRVNVNPLPVITFNAIPGICSSGAPYVLTEASPAGGVYSGPGVSETFVGSGVYEFDPSVVASNTLHTITYTYTDGNGCTNFNTATIEVYDNPTITLNPFADVCIDDTPFTLGGGFANGVDISTLPGVTYAYSGPGVSETPPASGNFEFDPATAGSGTHTISLSFSDANSCPALTNATATITVNPLPVVTMEPLPNQGICEAPYLLTEGRVGGSPVTGGRYYEINGLYVTEPTPGNFFFDPSIAGVGTHDIIFEYQDPTTGCMNSVTGQIIVEDYPVISLAPFPNVGICTAPFTLSGGLPVDQNRTPAETGVYTGPGVSEMPPGSGIYQFNPATAGVGIHLIQYDYTDQYGCTDFGEVQTITVEPLPFAVFGPMENICVDAAPVELTTGQPAGGVYSGAGVSETSAGSGVYEFDPGVAGVGTHILDYEVSDGFGCSTTEQQTVEVTGLPSGTISATGAFCNGGPLQFDLTGIAPFEIVYEDDKSNTFNAVNVGNIYVQSVDPVENTTYTLVSVTDRYGCTQSSLPPGTATITITPVASFDADPPLQILPGKTVTVTNNTNAGNWTYTWEFGDDNTISGTSGPVNITHPDGAVTTGTFEDPVHTYATYGNYLMELTVTDGNCVGEATQIITIEPLPPIVDFTIDTSSGCVPLTVNFTNSTEFADEDTYLWQFGEGEGFSNAQNPTYIYNNPGVFTVTLTAFNDLGIAVTESREMAVEVFEQPQARFSVRPTTVYLPDKPVFFTNLSFGADAYLWDFGDGNTSTEFEPIHIYEKPGIYDVTLTAFNGDQCSDVHTIEEAVIALNGGDIKIPTVFTPDPGGPNGGNVARGTVENNVFIPLIEGAVEFRMEVYSRWGELVFASNSQTTGWDGYYRGKVAKQGVYLYKVTVTFRDGEKITRVGDVTLLR